MEDFFSVEFLQLDFFYSKCHLQRRALTQLHSKTKQKKEKCAPTWGSSNIHDLEIPRFYDGHSESTSRWQVTQRQHNFTEIDFLLQERRHKNSDIRYLIANAKPSGILLGTNLKFNSTFTFDGNKKRSRTGLEKLSFSLRKRCSTIFYYFYFVRASLRIKNIQRSLIALKTFFFASPIF